MVLNDKTYQIMKWFCLIAAPALTAFYCVLDQVFSWGYADKVATISTAFCAMLGALIGISNNNYNKQIEPEDVDE